jgi:hypothetical protein
LLPIQYSPTPHQLIAVVSFEKQKNSRLSQSHLLHVNFFIGYCAWFVGG